jgi:hypothetical protein
LIRASWSIVVDCKPEVVFDYVADLKNEPQWNPDASNIVKKTDGDIRQGTVFEEDYRRVGHYVTTVDRYDKPRDLGFDARNPKTDALVRFHFEPRGDAQTEVACQVELTMKGAMKIAEPLIGPMVRGQIEKKRGPMLKRAVEARAG